MSKTDPVDNYGFNGFGSGPQFPGPILEEHGLNLPSYGQPGYGRSHVVSSNNTGYPYQGNEVHPSVPPHGAPIPPPKERVPPRVPIKLGVNESNNGNYRGIKSESENDKRKSWIKKRFSRG